MEISKIEAACVAQSNESNQVNKTHFDDSIQDLTRMCTTEVENFPENTNNTNDEMRKQQQENTQPDIVKIEIVESSQNGDLS